MSNNFFDPTSFQVSAGTLALSASINDLANGLEVSFDAVEVAIDSLIDGTGFDNDAIAYTKLKITNSPTDGYALTYDSVSGEMKWVVTEGVGETNKVKRDSDLDTEVYVGPLLDGKSTVTSGTSNITLLTQKDSSYTLVHSIEMTAASKTVTAPDATTMNKGRAWIIENSGSTNSFAFKNNGGSTVATVYPGEIIQVFLNDNSSSNGAWTVHQIDFKIKRDAATDTPVYAGPLLDGKATVTSGSDNIVLLTQKDSSYTLVHSIEMTAASKTVTAPDATTMNEGRAWVIENSGATNSFAFKDDGGSTLATIYPGEIVEIFLNDNSSSNGAWTISQVDFKVKRDAATDTPTYVGTYIDGGATVTSGSANILLVNQKDATYTLRHQIEMTAASKTVKLPDATTCNEGRFAAIDNSGSTNSFDIIDDSSSVLATIGPGDKVQVFLDDNSTGDGDWSISTPDFYDVNVSGTLTCDAGATTAAVITGSTSAALQITDSGGAVDEKTAELVNADGELKLIIKTDAGGTAVDDVININPTNGIIGLGTPASGNQLTIGGLGTFRANRATGAIQYMYRDDASISASNILGSIRFGGDGGDDNTGAAQINGVSDGTWSSGDTPTRLILSTCPAGSSTAVERIRIKGNGHIGIGGETTPDTVLHVDGEITQLQGSEPSDPDSGDSVIWYDSTTGAGYYKSNVGGTTTDRLIGGAMTKSEVFTGSGTFNVPADVEWVDVELVAGGGSGGTGDATDGGGGGGGGGEIVKRRIVVTPSGSETVTIGAGGAAVTTNNTAGNAGSNSSFGSHITAYGGGAGQPNALNDGGDGGVSGSINGTPVGGAGTGSNGGDGNDIDSNDTLSAFRIPGGSGGGGGGVGANTGGAGGNCLDVGGATSGVGDANGGGAGGGGASLGPGGTGGDAAARDGVSAGANTGAGGGGGSYNGDSGAGGSGKCTVTYFSAIV